MKRIIFTLAAILPVAASAQNYQGMSEQDMQRMMQQAQQMQACMEQVDQKELQELEQRSLEMEDQVRKLCADGERDEAQTAAIKFGREISTSPALQQITKCGEMMGNMMPKIPFSGDQESDSEKHVCDSL